MLQLLLWSCVDATRLPIRIGDSRRVTTQIQTLTQESLNATATLGVSGAGQCISTEVVSLDELVRLLCVLAFALRSCSTEAAGISCFEGINDLSSVHQKWSKSPTQTRKSCMDKVAMNSVGATLPADKLVNLIASLHRDVISTMLRDVDYLKSDYGISVGTECRLPKPEKAHLGEGKNKGNQGLPLIFRVSFTNQVRTHLHVL